MARLPFLSGLMLIGVLLAAPLAKAADHTSPSKSFIQLALQQTVLPDHQRFEDVIEELNQALQSLCADDTGVALATSRQMFKASVQAWSRIEMYRFGPARQNNLYERLFFWPDSRSRGLRQVQRILLEKDASAVTAVRLRTKSVAVQGLLALEVVLFGDGAETLGNATDSFRCEYAKALGEVLRGHAQDLNAGWQGKGGHADLMRQAGSPGAVYQTEGEAVQAFLKSTAEHLELIRDVKLARVMTDEGPWYPRRAVFHRSGSVLTNVGGNIAALESLLAGEVFSSMLTEEDQRLIQQWEFEIQQIKRVLSTLEASGQTWEVLVSQAESQSRLRYVLQPLTGAYSLAGQAIPQALGLIVGFNSLDGD